MSSCRRRPSFPPPPPPPTLTRQARRTHPTDDRVVTRQARSAGKDLRLAREERVAGGGRGLGTVGRRQDAPIAIATRGAVTGAGGRQSAPATRVSCSCHRPHKGAPPLAPAPPTARQILHQRPATVVVGRCRRAGAGAGRRSHNAVACTRTRGGVGGDHGGWRWAVGPQERKIAAHPQTRSPPLLPPPPPPPTPPPRPWAGRPTACPLSRLQASPTAARPPPASVAIGDDAPSDATATRSRGRGCPSSPTRLGPRPRLPPPHRRRHAPRKRRGRLPRRWPCSWRGLCGGIAPLRRHTPPPPPPRQAQ
ncbi:hypothetical protein I4F81_001353 [Pyropia yezoensis]|uniref:Uncharacterized protein n=1 Tax=Pyropia yezoensis TaxID=2788 RepID=A0ACC3BLG4_PYRYE|nr:hypothetical protein I4F81_001353 [Neopyropia yezoensis]